MNKKAQEREIGVFVMLFLTLIVGVILFTAVAQESGKSTSLTNIQNRTVSAGAAGTVITLTDVQAIYGVIITNASGTINASNNLQVPASNYTVRNRQLSNGNLVTTITVNAGGEYSNAGASWNISATSAEPLTYIQDSAARSIVPLIAIFFALAIAIVALTPTLREGFLNAIGK